MRAVHTIPLLAALMLSARPGSADDSRLEARLSCRREPSPGRVLCEVEIEVPEGRLAWADALVASSPAFARPLRSRIGPPNAVGGTDKRLRFPVALGATREGQGELAVRARAVVCVPHGGAEVCTPRLRKVSAKVEVGGGEQH